MVAIGGALSSQPTNETNNDNDEARATRGRETTREQRERAKQWCYDNRSVEQQEAYVPVVRWWALEED